MSVVVKGLPELKAEFARVEREVRTKVVRKGASVGARALKIAIEPRIPVKSGTLKRALLIKYAREKSNETQAAYVVTFRQGKKLQVGAITKRKGKFFKRVLSQDAYYARFVEGGHQLRRKRGGPSVGFVPGRFFFRDAIRGAAPAALQKMVDAMSTEIIKIVK